MDWTGKRVLVTGAGGFIGSHLVEAIAKRGGTVRAFVHYNSRGDAGLLSLLPREVLRQLEIIPGDLRDSRAVTQVVDGASIVFHLGAVISIPYSYVHPYEVAQTNFLGTLNVLQACRDCGVDRLVHTSSSEVYGTALQVPIDEYHPLQGQSPYSASKIGADKLVESYHRAYGLPVVTLRPFNTYGPRQSARAVVPTIVTQALAREVVRLGNTEARRDLTFVSDTVDGFLKVAETPGVEGMVFNLGSGSDISIAELAQRIMRLIGRPREIVIETERKRPERSEVDQLVADNTLARERLGWEPRITLEDGLRRTIDWVSDHLYLYDVHTYKI